MTCIYIRVFKGVLWQDVWVIRAMYHGISSEVGMMEFSNIDRTTVIPDGLGKYPTGRKRGCLEGVYSALRMSQESNSLITLDIIYDGTKTKNKIINPDIKNDLKIETIQFQDLLLSTAFHSSLLPPPMNKNETENLPKDLSISQKKVLNNLQNKLLCDEDIRYVC